MKTIQITVEGGVIQDISNIPKNVRVQVIDYDTQGAEKEILSEDSDGNEFVESIWY